MSTDGSPRRARSLKLNALQVATLIALVAVYGASPAGQAAASAPARTRMAQSSNDDPCRYATAEAIGNAFGRQLKSSKHVNFCQYQGTGTDLVIVKVAAGPEGTILRHVKSAAAQGHKGAEKLTTTVGEAYFDSILPAFIGRVGNSDVQIETTIEPVPRDAMIAVGRRIMESIVRR
jgi:hypothetical protein